MSTKYLPRKYVTEHEVNDETQDVETSSPRSRGRPSAVGRSSLPTELIAAMENQLRQKCHLDLTNREIASAAGTHAGTIHYYYNGKEGLIDAALEEFSADVANVLAELERQFESDCERATSTIIKAWLALHQRHSGITSIIWIESFRSESKIFEHYRLRMARNTVPKMQRIIRVLVRNGYYKPDLDIELAAFGLLCSIHSPMIMGTLMTRFGHSVDHLAAAWLEQVAEMLEREFR